MQLHSQDTIAAIATPPGIGALGIIRVSGHNAIEVLNTIFPKKDLTKVKSHTLHFGALVYEGHILDEVLLSVFKGPQSYTGENSIEISCHGSPYILQRVMETLVQLGIRPAGPGEFTMRAFMNGRLDLSQAEAVADLIASESEAAHRVAIEQMRGGFSLKIKELRAQLLQFASLIELELDFAEEDVEFANRDKLSALLKETETEVEKLATSFQLGNAVKAGVNVVIAGRPNAGKSTLLNKLLNEERAIVSDIPGTTRDTIEDILVIEGIRFRFIDTAGLRKTTDTLESIGIGRTHDKMREAHQIIYLFDVNTLNEDELNHDLQNLQEEYGLDRILVIGNKIDQDAGDTYAMRYKAADKYYFISGKEGIHIDGLKKRLVNSLDLPINRLNDPLITNIRHFHALNGILNAIHNIQQGMALGITTDFIASDIRIALHQMGEITGEITSDEILGNIFSQFCIGK